MAPNRIGISSNQLLVDLKALYKLKSLLIK
jgi:hypothetical protein